MSQLNTFSCDGDATQMVTSVTPPKVTDLEFLKDIKLHIDNNDTEFALTMIEDWIHELENK